LDAEKLSAMDARVGNILASYPMLQANYDGTGRTPIPTQRKLLLRVEKTASALLRALDSTEGPARVALSSSGAGPASQLAIALGAVSSPLLSEPGARFIPSWGWAPHPSPIGDALERLAAVSELAVFAFSGVKGQSARYAQLMQIHECTCSLLCALDSVPSDLAEAMAQARFTNEDQFSTLLDVPLAQWSSEDSERARIAIEKGIQRDTGDWQPDEAPIHRLTSSLLLSARAVRGSLAPESGRARTTARNMLILFLGELFVELNGLVVPDERDGEPPAAADFDRYACSMLLRFVATCLEVVGLDAADVWQGAGSDEPRSFIEDVVFRHELADYAPDLAKAFRQAESAVESMNPSTAKEP
jgi:hypothetical protein